MADPGLIEIEVVYALAERQTIIALEVPAGTTVEQAITRSDIAMQHPELDLKAAQIGIYGKRVPRHSTLKANDRVEIYRPLLIDPKAARRLRAARR